MEQKWKITVWGVRGSMPTPSEDFLRYGGNTSCLSVDCGSFLAVFDAGSGLAQLGKRLKNSDIKRVDLFLSHLHIDHVIGLFGFRAFHDPEMEIHLYGEAREGVSFRQQLETLIGPPYWPLSLKDFPARLRLCEIGPEQFIPLPDGIFVRTLRGNHPNGSIYFRLEDDKRSMVYALDCELEEAFLPQIVRFAQNTDLMVCDASFTAEELTRRRGWGHSSWQQCLALRRACGAKLALLTHYSDSYDDRFLRQEERLAAAEDPDAQFAREGMEVLL